jgi:hypothetical protein
MIEWDDIKQGFWTWKAEQKDEDGSPIEDIYDPFKDDVRPSTVHSIQAMQKKMKGTTVGAS